MSAPASGFDALYGGRDDPWQVSSRWYEQRKRALLLASLPKARYRRAFEPACGTGELTRTLADRCDAVLASDFSREAVRLAGLKLTGATNVRVERQDLPADWPQGQFDLIVVSEWAYYLDGAALAAVSLLCGGSLADDGTLVACHWLPGFEDRHQDTVAVHAALGSYPGLRRVVHHHEPDFLLEVWSLQDRSVAQLEGLR